MDLVASIGLGTGFSYVNTMITIAQCVLFSLVKVSVCVARAASDPLMACYRFIFVQNNTLGGDVLEARVHGGAQANDARVPRPQHLRAALRWLERCFPSVRQASENHRVLSFKNSFSAVSEEIDF